MGQYSEDSRVDGILQAVAAFKKNAPQNYLDAAYGANRALNGASFGGLDHLGDRYGFDSRMNGYLSLLSPQERLLREGLSGALQTGGAMLPIARLWQGLRVPVSALMVNAIRWNGRRNLVNQLRRGKDFKDINFGKVDDDTLNQVNDLRRNTGYDELSGNAYIPANVVRKFYNKRLSEGYTPEKMSEMGKRLFHEGSNKVGESNYPHIQKILRPREGISEVGYISKNPSNGQTVIKSMYKKTK